MAMKSVGRQAPFEVPSPLKLEGEDIVYSMIERHSGKASQPSTTASSSIAALILNTKRSLILGSFFYKQGHEEEFIWILPHYQCHSAR